MTKEESKTEAFVLDKNVMNIILESVCGDIVANDESENDVSDDDMADNSCSDQQSSENEGGIFSMAASMDLDNGGSEDVSMDEKSASDDQSEEEDIELEPSALENLLLEDSDAESDSAEQVLEHHAGADSALAQLIKVKQDARKEGQKRREKTETSHRLRCLVLLESIFSRSASPSDEIVLMSIVPLLRTMKELEKSISNMASSLDGGKKMDNSLMNEKRAILDRISDLLSTKIAKLNLGGSANVESCTALASQVARELKKSTSTSHSSCCNSILAFLIKAVSENIQNSIAVASLFYIDAVKE